MPIFPALIPFLTCAVLAAGWSLARRRAASEQQARAREAATIQDLVRLVRLSAADLRGTAVGLLGRAQSGQETERGFLVSAQASLLDVADALLRQTDAPEAVHYLREEPVRLRPVLDFVIAQVTCQLGPGRRAWRIAEDLHGIELLADRRALHQILLRVLTSAALSTREGDWITIGSLWSEAAMDGSAPDGSWMLTIEDEGAGLPIGGLRKDGRETRGLGVGLTLANSLMQAHGGTLLLQSVVHVGTRAGLAFPANRLIAGRREPELCQPPSRSLSLA